MSATVIIFPPLSTHVGFCIFCGGVGETDDHVVPLALGGQHVLRKSSCEACRDFFNREVDQPVLKGLLLPPRLHYGLGRSKKRPPPTHAKVTMPGNIVGPIGSGMRMPLFRTATLPIAETHRTIMMPVLPPPSILSGKSASEEGGFTIAGMTTFDGVDMFKKQGGGIIGIDDFILMFRMLAKSAFSLSYLVQPRPVYSQLILPFIRGEINDAGWLCGNLGDDDIQTALPYQFKLREHGLYLIASVQVFTKQGMPFYDFVLGRLPGFAAYRL